MMNKETLSYIHIVAAVWQDADGRFFLAQRGQQQSLAGYWEFPGGKVEPGEEEATALARELSEEFGIKAKVGEFIHETYYQYDFGLNVRLRFYRILQADTAPEIREHAALAWVFPQQLLSYHLAPADIEMANYLFDNEGFV